MINKTEKILLTITLVATPLLLLVSIELNIGWISLTLAIPMITFMIYTLWND